MIARPHWHPGSVSDPGRPGHRASRWEPVCEFKLVVGYSLHGPPAVCGTGTVMLVAMVTGQSLWLRLRVRVPGPGLTRSPSLTRDPPAGRVRAAAKLERAESEALAVPSNCQSSGSEAAGSVQWHSVPLARARLGGGSQFKFIIETSSWPPAKCQCRAGAASLTRPGGLVSHRIGTDVPRPWLHWRHRDAGVTVLLRSLVCLTRRGPRPAGPPAGFDPDSRRFSLVDRLS